MTESVEHIMEGALKLKGYVDGLEGRTQYLSYYTPEDKRIYSRGWSKGMQERATTYDYGLAEERDDLAELLTERIKETDTKTTIINWQTSIILAQFVAVALLLIYILLS